MMGRRSNPIDCYVGRRIRERRKIVGMTQRELGDTLGVSYQQVQKYERGKSRVGPSALLTLSQALGVKVSFFFEDLEQNGTPRKSRHSEILIDPDILAHSQVLALVRGFVQIRDGALRRRLLLLVDSLAQGKIKN